MSEVVKPYTLFSDFCDLCESLQKQKSLRAKKSLLVKFALHCKVNKSDFEHVLCLLLPEKYFRNNRPPTKKFWCQLFAAETQTDEFELKEKANKDLSAALSEVTPTGGSFLKLEDAFNLVNQMHATEDLLVCAANFRGIYERLNRRDVLWLFRVVTHDLKLKTSEKVILEGIHDDAYDLFRYRNDLKAVADCLKTGVTYARMAVNIPAMAMLAKSATILTLAHFTGKCFVEIKIDGERCVVHKAFATALRSFTRSGLGSELSDKMKEAVRRAFANLDCFILDCEISRVETATGNLLPQCYVTQSSDETHLQLTVFDFLLYGEDVVDAPMNWLDEKPLSVRRQKLEHYFQASADGIVSLSVKETVESPTEVKAFYDRVVADKHEGVVLKKCSDQYTPGIKNWIKIKRTETVKLTIAGAFQNPRTGSITSFLLVTLDRMDNMFKTVVKLGNFKDVDSDALLQECRIAVIKSKADCVSMGGLSPTLFFDPKRAPVVELRVGSTCVSSKYTVTDSDGDCFTLKEPAFVKQRQDKNWKTADDVQRLRTVVASFGKAKTKKKAKVSKKKAESSSKKAKGSKKTKSSKQKVESSSKKTKRSTKKRKATARMCRTQDTNPMDALISSVSVRSSRRTRVVNSVPSISIDDLLSASQPRLSKQQRKERHRAAQKWKREGMEMRGETVPTSAVAAIRSSHSSQPSQKRRRTVTHASAVRRASTRLTPIPGYCERGEGSLWRTMERSRASFQKHYMCKWRNPNGSKTPMPLIERVKLQSSFPRVQCHESEGVKELKEFLNSMENVDCHMEPCVPTDDDLFCSQFSDLLKDSILD